MRLELVPRASVSPIVRALSPLIAIMLAGLMAALVIALMGRSPVAAFDIYIREPLGDSWALQEMGIKMIPLTLIATGLVYCFRANLWNIGAEGQYTMGAIVGSILPLATQGMELGRWLLVIALVTGAIGGALYALIPSYLRVRLGVSEILSSLMLVYIAQLILDYLVRGPWRDPKGFNFPQTVMFDKGSMLPILFEDGRLHAGLILAIIVVVASTIVLGWSLFGYAIKVIGSAPKAAGFSGFSASAISLTVFAISGGLAGLAGIVEVTGQIGQLKPSISAGYGFTAITVAFLGRLHPLGVVFGAFVVSLTAIGGENAQIMMKLPLDLTTCFQGLLLLSVLAADALASSSIRVVRTPNKEA